MEETISAALIARRRNHAAELKRCRIKLAAADAQVVDHTLLTMLMTAVTRAGERGWQPSELVRQVRRAYTATHAELLAAAFESKMPEAADIDHRLDVLFLVQTLPPIGLIVPSLSGMDDRMLGRVRALLAKAESTDFPEEAEALTAKAQQLIARHSIDQALLATSGTAGPTSRRVGIDNPYEAPKTLLLQVVAQANRCRAVWMKQYGLVTVVGFPGDLDSTELLFTSLLVQAIKAMTQHNPRQDRYGRNNIRSFRQSFLTAYADRIGERLNAATEQATSEVDHSNLLPVLAARSAAVQDAFTRQFPSLTSQTTSVSNRDGWLSGRAAADRASLHGRESVTGTSSAFH